jgi:enterochelin esterase-like enzyme
MKKISIAFMLFLDAFAFAQVSMAQSRIITDSIYSKSLKTYRLYNVFLPKSFGQNKNKKYPILYLLHGMYETNQVWTVRGHLKDVMDRLIASGEACEMIVVTPDAGGNINAGHWNGYFDMPRWNYETFFYKEFVPYIESKYRVIGDKRHRAIAGLSMGGGGATSYAERHTDMFCAAYAMSALMSIPEHGAVQSQRSDDKMVILTKSVLDHNCVKYVADANENIKEQLCSVDWFVDCGDDDFLLDRNIEFYQAMRNAGIPCQFRVRDGAHDWEYWHSALYTCLSFVTRAFNK